ncbi:hypothetical protein FRC20_001084, partial [Serendipita sp. 405]
GHQAERTKDDERRKRDEGPLPSPSYFLNNPITLRRWNYNGFCVTSPVHHVENSMTADREVAPKMDSCYITCNTRARLVGAPKVLIPRREGSYGHIFIMIRAI